MAWGFAPALLPVLSPSPPPLDGSLQLLTHRPPPGSATHGPPSVGGRPCSAIAALCGGGM